MSSDQNVFLLCFPKYLSWVYSRLEIQFQFPHEQIYTNNLLIHFLSLPLALCLCCDTAPCCSLLVLSTTAAKGRVRGWSSTSPCSAHRYIILKAVKPKKAKPVEAEAGKVVRAENNMQSQWCTLKKWMAQSGSHMLLLSNASYILRA